MLSVDVKSVKGAERHADGGVKIVVRGRTMVSLPSLRASPMSVIAGAEGVVGKADAMAVCSGLQKIELSKG